MRRSLLSEKMILSEMIRLAFSDEISGDTTVGQVRQMAIDNTIKKIVGEEEDNAEDS